MPTPITSIRLDPELKRRATAKAQRMHIPLATVINHALKDFIERDDTVRLGVSPTEWAEIEQAARDADEGKNVSAPFHTFKEVKAHLDTLKSKK